jgi:hypothetical protein
MMFSAGAFQIAGFENKQHEAVWKKADVRFASPDTIERS